MPSIDLDPKTATIQQPCGKEQRHKGKQCLRLDGKEIRTTGSLIRTAFLDGEGYDFLEAPQTALETLRRSGTRIDLFTFIQKLSDTAPKYDYPMELDNMAVLPIS